jgi:hypothetical protein
MSQNPDKLKLGKGSAFVKRNLQALPQGDDTWEADFFPLPTWEARHGMVWLGMVISHAHEFVITQRMLDEPPNVNDLARLLADAMLRPLMPSGHRPATILFRARPEWSELTPHLEQLGIRVGSQESLPKWDRTFGALYPRSQESAPGTEAASVPPPSEQSSGQVVPVKLTSVQRKIVADLMPELASRLKLDEPNQRTIRFTQAELEGIQARAREEVPKAATGMVCNSLRHIVDATTQALERIRTTKPPPPSGNVYQFKITLCDSQPAVWRRIQVEDCTLDKLHEHIQTAMGWTNSHLHDFTIDGQSYGDPLLMEENFEEFDYRDSTTTNVSAILPSSGKRFRFTYQYDFGDSWQHEVLFEGIVPPEKGKRYPLCLEGARACPPEDVGGVWGFQDFLDAIADPDHEQHEEMLHWSGPYNPEAFNPTTATRRMRKGLPDWRQWA